MSRYIDADKAMEEIERIGGHNLCDWSTLGVKALIDRQPTADVVPKSEVEGLQKKIDDYIVEVFTLEQTIGKLKAENDELEINLAAMRTEANSYKTQYENLAQEIFAEIENLYMEEHNGCAVHMSRYEFAELKKKYTED